MCVCLCECGRVAGWGVGKGSVCRIPHPEVRSPPSRNLFFSLNFTPPPPHTHTPRISFWRVEGGILPDSHGPATSWKRLL